MKARHQLGDPVMVGEPARELDHSAEVGLVEAPAEPGAPFLGQRPKNLALIGAAVAERVDGDRPPHEPVRHREIGVHLRSGESSTSPDELHDAREEFSSSWWMSSMGRRSLMALRFVPGLLPRCRTNLP